MKKKKTGAVKDTGLIVSTFIFFLFFVWNCKT